MPSVLFLRSLLPTWGQYRNDAGRGTGSILRRYGFRKIAPEANLVGCVEGGTHLRHMDSLLLPLLDGPVGRLQEDRVGGRGKARDHAAPEPEQVA